MFDSSVRLLLPTWGKPRQLDKQYTDLGHSRTAKQRDELAAFHSITSSARASSVGGMSRSSALAVVTLMTRSNLVGCSTGMSPGFAPCSILCTKSPTRRNNYFVVTMALA